MGELFCTNCGEKLESGSAFCENCGTTVEDKQSADQAPVCSNCGDKLEPGSAFCESCGTATENASPAQNAQTPQVSQSIQASQPTKESQNSSQQGKGLIFAIVAIVVVAVIVAVVIFTQDENPVGEGENNTPAQEQTEDSSNSSTSTPAEEPSHTATPSAITMPPEFTMVKTSSILAPDNTTSNYGGINAMDGMLDTAWNEGSPGDGTGEWIEFYNPTPQHVTSVSIAGGYPKLYKDGSDVYYKNNRPRQITITYNGGSQTYMMQDLRGQFQTFTLPQPVDTTSICIIIDSVYQGANYNDCCIAEVKIS